MLTNKGNSMNERAESRADLMALEYTLLQAWHMDDDKTVRFPVWLDATAAGRYNGSLENEAKLLVHCYENGWGLL